MAPILQSAPELLGVWLSVVEASTPHATAVRLEDPSGQATGEERGVLRFSPSPGARVSRGFDASGRLSDNQSCSPAHTLQRYPLQNRSGGANVPPRVSVCDEALFDRKNT